MKIESLNHRITSKLSETVELWADEYLVGKPAILANAVYHGLEKMLLEDTNKIIDMFKEKGSN